MFASLSLAVRLYLQQSAVLRCRSSRLQSRRAISGGANNWRYGGSNSNYRRCNRPTELFFGLNLQ
jgi:hypothetical protein